MSFSEHSLESFLAAHGHIDVRDDGALRRRFRERATISIIMPFEPRRHRFVIARRRCLYASYRRRRLSDAAAAAGFSPCIPVLCHLISHFIERASSHGHGATR